MIGPNSGNDAVMWEVRVVDGREQQLLTWIEETIVPELSRQSGCRDVRVYRSDQQRAVVIAHFSGAPADLPEPPEELVARPVHQWPFELVSAHDLREQR